MSEKSGFLKTLGPGILFAGAAIGVSHLVQSTRAGANFGFALFSLVVLTNLLKYPFFEFAHRYTASTGESMLHGYSRIGKWVITLFFVLSIATSFINISAITLVTAGLTEYLFHTGLSPVVLSIIILISVLVILILGQYPLLDRLMKIMIIVLSITTIVALTAAFKHGMSVKPDFVKPDVWTLSSVAFLLALMGWMPAPIEVSVWPSLWLLERKKQTGHHPSLKHSLSDFYIGYIGTALLALAFLSLGALVMYGTGETFSNSGVVFSGQLVSLYSKSLGEWSTMFIGAAAWVTMFSTTITVIDAYPRTLSGSMVLSIVALDKWHKPLYWIWLIFLALTSVVVIVYFQKSMKSLIDIATILAFLAAPVFAFMNYSVVTRSRIPGNEAPPTWLKIIAWFGLVYLFGFSLFYVVTRFI